MKPRIPLPDHLKTASFTVQAGIAAGMGTNRLRGSDLQAPFHGVRTTKRGSLSLADLASSYQAQMPQHAFFCAITAAIAWGIPLPLHHERSRLLHVAAPVPHKAPRGKGVVGHKAPRGKGVVGHTVQVAPRDIRFVRGLRISSPERVWCELAAVLSLPDLVAAGDYLVRRRHPVTSIKKLALAASTYPGRRGKRLLHIALPLINNRSDSRKESCLRVMVVTAGFQGLAVNMRIVTSGGYVYFPDLAFPAHRVLIEYQGDYHRDSTQYRADMTRRSRLEADNWFIMWINADDLVNPEELLQRIRVVLRAHPAR